ncbi:MAG: diacylglycerol kinase family protein [Bacteroidota bacterium]
MLKANILFIINPIAGGKKKEQIPAIIEACLDRSKFNATYSFTAYVGHAAILAEEAAGKNFDVIVAVGGDGTINEIAGKLMQQNKILGIIPFGSGNGLARSLKIPLAIKKAIQVINAFHTERVDGVKLNNSYFFNMAGMGFDAQVSAAFAGNKTRGLIGYVSIGFKEMISYKPQTYQLVIDGINYTREAYIVSIANSSQYGNNVYISPQSSLNDGLLEVCIIKPFSLYRLPTLAYEMIRAKTHLSKKVEIIKGKKIQIIRTDEDYIHLDGEPIFKGKVIEIEVMPGALNVITPLKQ